MPIHCINGKPNDPSVVEGFMCRTDFECELGGAIDGNKIYPSIEAAKEYLKCWESCGIVKVEVVGIEVVVEGTDS
jgi:hypothetical protein